MSTADRALARIAVAALLLRLALLVARGDYIMYDEGYYLLLARSLSAGEGFRLSGLPHVALSPLQPAIVALVSLLGVPALWASRLLAAVAGALLVVPVAAIGRRLGGRRAGIVAASLVAAAPALMTFVPFFPGESPNLYFGSEPLYLLLAFGAIAAGMRAARDGGPRWWALTGALGALAFLARGEGLILGPMVVLVLGIEWLRTRPLRRAWRAPALAAATAIVCVAPYLLYLRSELGRWALSGRVQAAAPAVPAGVGDEAQAPTAESAASTASQPRRRSGSAAEDLMWRGDEEGYWNAAYRLDASGTRMSSQYWGVPPRAAPPPVPVVALAGVPGDAGARSDTAATAPSSPAAAVAGDGGGEGTPESLRRATLLARGIALVVPLWLLLAAVAGLAHRERGRALLWLSPALAGALLPTILVYVEPRALLPLLPVAALGAALALEALARRLPRSLPGGVTPRRLVAGLAAAGAALLVAPAVRDLARTAAEPRPLQRVASSRRAVAQLLAAKLPADAIIASWHPSVAYFADRDWRVLPYEPLDRVLGYARAQGVSAIVLSRFEPSPLSDPAHPFQVLLLDPAAPPPDVRAPHLATVEEMPLVVVRRVLPAGAR